MVVPGRAIYRIEAIACFQRTVQADFLDMSPYVCGKAQGMEGTDAGWRDL